MKKEVTLCFYNVFRTFYKVYTSANITIIDKKTNKPILYSDYATEFINEWKTSAVFAKSKSTNVIKWDYGKESTLKGTFEVFTLQLLALIAGSSFKKGTDAQDIFKREVLTVVASNKVTLTLGTPVAGSLSVFLLDPDDNLTQLTEQTLGDPATNQNEYSVSTSTTLTFNSTTAPVGTKVVCYYAVVPATDTQTLTFYANQFPTAVEIYADTMFRDTDGLDKYVQVHYLNARAQGNINLTLSASAITKLEITFDILKSGSSDDMAEYTIL